MITEVADFRVQAEQREAFVQALALGLETVLSLSVGYQGHEVLVSQESADRVLLLVRWVSTEAHTVGFRQSPAFAQWRAIIGPFFAQAPFVEHFDSAVKG